MTIVDYLLRATSIIIIQWANVAINILILIVYNYVRLTIPHNELVDFIKYDNVFAIFYA